MLLTELAVLLLWSTQHHHQHGQIHTQNRPPSHLCEAVRNVIPAPDACSPTEEYGRQDFPSRFWNQPENECIEEPALRHQGGKQEQKRITISIADQRQQDQRSGKNEYWDEVLIVAELMQPQNRPFWHHDQTQYAKCHARQNAAPAHVSKEHWQSDLRLCHGCYQQQRKEGAGRHQRRPLRG